MARDQERDVKMKKNSREFSRNENLALNMPIGGKFAGDLVAGFSALEPIIKKESKTRI